MSHHTKQVHSHNRLRDIPLGQLLALYRDTAKKTNLAITLENIIEDKEFNQYVIKGMRVK